MIYCTAWDKLEDTAELYEEWVGHKPKFKGTSANSYLVVARDNNKIVGALQLFVIDDQIWDRKWALVENVKVADKYKRKGVGCMLMKFAEQQASIYDCSFIKLTSRKQEGKALYRALGYEEGSSFRKELR